MNPRRLLAIAAMFAIAGLTLWALVTRASGDLAPAPIPTIIAPQPVPAPSPSAPPTATAAPTSTDPPEPSIAEDDQVASDLIHEAVVTAVLGAFYSDSNETPQARAERLAKWFVPGSPHITEPPLLTLDAANTTTEGHINQISPLATDAPDRQELVVSVTWGAAWWPNANGNTSHVQGVMDLEVSVRLHEGRWLVDTISIIN